MSTFICSKCGCIDNSALDGNYWLRHFEKNKNKSEELAPVLCSECNGKLWHNKFDKKHWSTYGTKEELIAESKKKQGNYDNAVEYFKGDPK